MGRVWALGRWTGTRTAQSPGWWMHGRTGVARVCGGWSRRGIGWKWKWTRGSPGWPFRSTGRTCRSSLRTTHANVRRRWHARALLVACQLGFYGHPLLLCVPTATFDPRSFLYFVPVLTVRYFIGCTGVVSMTVVSRWTCMYSCWNYRDMSLGRGRSLGEART